MSGQTTIKPIRTKEDYRLALGEAAKLMRATDGTELDRLEVLSILLEEYEEKQYPTEYPHPIRAIEIRMGELGINQKKLGEILGTKSRASEILGEKRKLNLRMIRILHKELDIPIEILMQEY